MKKILNILTPENVYVEYELAGIGSRFAAFIIDLLIQLFVFAITLLCLYFAGFNYTALVAELSYQALIFAITILILFHLLYFSLLELIMNGQTPGKKLLNIRVIRQSGDPEGVFDSGLRNFLRIVYIIPLLYLLDAFFVILTKNYKRIGDYAANTIVVKVRKGDKLVTVDDILNQKLDSDDYTENTNIFPVSHFEYEVLKEFLARKDSVGERRYVFAYNFNKYFSRKFDLVKPYSNPYDFFEDIIRMNSGIN
ncbi:RDD family protein [Acetivibrio cellulolyticus]|uniref:RDD family protein n=1 Tax=Acetivibrio cellulolyticus TaxID=35830 RepID=UPI0001E2DEC7|nr:RDD family protein [Acetivibrio cellulolyticus]